MTNKNTEIKTLLADRIIVNIRMLDFSINEYIKKTHNRYAKNIMAFHINETCKEIIMFQAYDAGFRVGDLELDLDLVGLYKCCTSHRVHVNVPKIILNRLEIISSWEDCEYDANFSIRIDTIQKYKSILEKWYNDIK